MSTWRKFWIANGNAAVRRYVRNCPVWATERATPTRQLMSDLPLAPLATLKSPFFRSGVDYLDPLNFSEGRRNQKALGLLFTCMASQAIYVELVTPLTLDNFFACLYLIYRPAWTGQYDLFR